MKKKAYIIILIFLTNFFSGCAGYKPIYTTNLQFEIADNTIKSNKKLGKQIYLKLYNLSKNSNKGQNPDIKSISIIINTKKDKYASVKDSAGTILEYKITISSNVTIKDYLTENVILDQNFSYSSSYKVHDQYSETIKMENKVIENIINNIYQNLLIKMSEKMLVR